MAAVAVLSAAWLIHERTVVIWPESQPLTAQPSDPRTAHLQKSTIATHGIASATTGDPAAAVLRTDLRGEEAATAVTADLAIPPLEYHPVDALTDLGPPLDADNPAFETDPTAGDLISLGPPMDADDIMGMAQTAATEAVSIGEHISADD